MNKKKFWVCNQVNESTAEILLYGFIGMFDEIDDAGFVMELRQLEAKYANVNLRINCGGGSVYMGIAMYNAIKASKATVNGYIDGIAASMGATLAAACKNLYISKYGRYMTHRVSGVSVGNADEMRETATQLETLEADIANMLSKRTGLTQDETKAKYITNTDRWINAAQAMEEKIVDGIYDADPVTVPDGNDVANVFNAYQQCLNKSQNQISDMKQIALLLGLAENAAEAEILAGIKKLQTEKAEAENKVGAIAKANAKALVDGAIAKGQLTETDRAIFEPMAETNITAATAAIAKIPAVKRPSEVITAKDKKTADGTDTDELPESWDKLIAKGDKYVAQFKVENAEQYHKLLNAYTKAPLAQA